MADVTPSNNQELRSAAVRNIVSRFEKKQEQPLDALPFRTVRNFFEGEERSIYVTQEKEKYDALMEKQRQEALLSSPSRGPRSRTNSNASVSSVGRVERREANNNMEEQEQEKELSRLQRQEGDLVKDEKHKAAEVVEESNQVEDATEPVADVAEIKDQTPAQSPVEEKDAVSPPPPPPSTCPPDETEEKEGSRLVETPEQEIKKRPILTTERSFVMEEDHTIETEDLIVVGERFSTDGEEDRDELMSILEDELQIPEEFEAKPSPVRRPKHRSIIPDHKYKKPENVPSKLFVPTAASLASRTHKSPVAVKKPQPSAKSAPKPTVSTPTPTKNRYANVQSKVKEMLNSAPPSIRKDSNSSDNRLSNISPASRSSVTAARGTLTGPERRHTTIMPGTRLSNVSPAPRLSNVSPARRSNISPASKSAIAAARNGQNGPASVDRRATLSSSTSRRASSFRTLTDLHGDEAHSDWEGRHRNERLSFASSSSSTDSSDPFALQLDFAKRKPRYDDVKPRYLDFTKGKSPVFARNQEAQMERRKKLEEANAAKSAERQKQLRMEMKMKEKREKEDLEAAVRRGDELHQLTQLLREKEKQEEKDRRLSHITTRRTLSSNGTGTESRRTPTSSVGASSPRTSLLSEPDSVPSAALIAAMKEAMHGNKLADKHESYAV